MPLSMTGSLTGLLGSRVIDGDGGTYSGGIAQKRRPVSREPGRLTGDIGITLAPTAQLSEVV